jgi:hypothetical protein
MTDDEASTLVARFYTPVVEVRFRRKLDIGVDV